MPKIPSKMVFFPRLGRFLSRFGTRKSWGLGKRRTLLLVFLGVSMPLALLLGLQYGWLVELERASTIARRVNFENYLNLIDARIKDFYTSAADRVLPVSPIYLTGNEKELTAFFRESIARNASHKAVLHSAKYVFLQSFTDANNAGPFFFDPATGRSMRELPEGLRNAVFMATLYWQILGEKAAAIRSQEYGVDESHPDFRLMLYPITDDKHSMLGVAGLVVNEAFFRSALLPQIIEETLAELAGEEPLFFCLKDASEKTLATYGEPPFRPRNPEMEQNIRKPLSFIFSDWNLVLFSDRSHLKKLGRSNFLFNMSLSLFLALTLMSGIVLALKTASREIKLSEMKNEFVSNVSHELRTPLSSIRVFGELLGSGKVVAPEKVREYGSYIETEGRRLSQLINNILDFSKIESGKKIYEFVLQDIGQIIDNVFKAFEIRSTQSHFKIHLKKDNVVLPRIKVDGSAIGQAFCNLLDNAVKYGGDGGEIWVSLKCSNHFIQIDVKDNGVGISKEEQAKVFDRFHRVNTDLVHDVKGSGLGLSIVKHVVSAHQGRLQLKSELGKGSTFSLFLPLKLSPGHGAAAEPFPRKEDV